MLDRWYRYINTDKTYTYNRDGQEINRPVQEKVYFDDPVVDNFSLEPKNKVPMDQNFVGISNYFLDYWGYILGPQVAFTYIRYVRHVYTQGFEPTIGLKKMATLMGISLNTLKKYLEELEKYGFVAIFYKDTKTTEKGKELIKTIIRIKVRKTIPYLTPDLVEKLPKELQEQHEKDLASLEKTSSITHEELKSIDEIFGINIGYQNLTPENDELSTGYQNLTPENSSDRVSKIDTTPYQNLTPLENNINTIGLDWTVLSEPDFLKVFEANGIDPNSKGATILYKITKDEKASSDQLSETLQQLNEQLNKGVFIRNEFGWIRSKLRELVAQEETHLQIKNASPSKNSDQKSLDEKKKTEPGKYDDVYL